MARTTAAAAQTTDGAQVAWVVATPSGQQLVGVAPDGSTVGQIDATNKAILRSPDGAIFYALSSRSNGDTSMAIIEMYSAATGSLQQTITGWALPLGNARGFDALDAMSSPDGRSLALLHQTSYIVTPAAYQVTKKDRKGGTRTISIDATTIINGVEVIDLAGARSLDYFKLDDAPDNLLGGQVVFAPDGASLYAFTAAGSFTPSVTAIQFDGKGLHTRGRATDGQNGRVVSRGAAALRAETHVQPDSRTLVRVVGPTVEWFDLQNLTVSGTVDLPAPPAPALAKPTRPATLFSPDGSRLYVVDTAEGAVGAVDLVQRAKFGSVTLPGIGASPLAGAQGAVLSPDGTRLYALQSDGLAVVSLPNLTVIGHWLPGVALRAVRLSRDGQTMFAVGLTDNRVYVLGADGHAINAVQFAMSVYSFAA